MVSATSGHLDTHKQLPLSRLLLSEFSWSLIFNFTTKKQVPKGTCFFIDQIIIKTLFIYYFLYCFFATFLAFDLPFPEIDFQWPFNSFAILATSSLPPVAI